MIQGADVGYDWEEEYKLVGVGGGGVGVVVNQAELMRSQRLQCAFHAGGAASCVGLSPQTQPRQQIQFYLYPGCDTNECGVTPPQRCDGSLNQCVILAMHLPLVLPCLQTCCWSQSACLLKAPLCACPTAQMLPRLMSVDANWLLVMAHWTVIALAASIFFLFPFGDECTGGEFHRGHQGWRKRLSARELHASLTLEIKKGLETRPQGTSRTKH